VTIISAIGWRSFTRALFIVDATGELRKLRNAMRQLPVVRALVWPEARAPSRCQNRNVKLV